jgi:hypothetical protein
METGTCLYYIKCTRYLLSHFIFCIIQEESDHDGYKAISWSLVIPEGPEQSDELPSLTVLSLEFPPPGISHRWGFSSLTWKLKYHTKEDL